MPYKVQHIKNLEVPVIANGDCALVSYTDRNEFLEVIDTGSQDFCEKLKNLRELRDKIHGILPEYM